MNSLKTTVMIAILGAVAYGVYVKLNESNQAPPLDVTDPWAAEAPTVDLNGGSADSTAPRYAPTEPGGLSYPPATGEAPSYEVQPMASSEPATRYTAPADGAAAVAGGTASTATPPATGYPSTEYPNTNYPNTNYPSTDYSTADGPHAAPAAASSPTRYGDSPSYREANASVAPPAMASTESPYGVSDQPHGASAGASPQTTYPPASTTAPSDMAAAPPGGSGGTAPSYDSFNQLTPAPSDGPADRYAQPQQPAPDRYATSAADSASPPDYRQPGYGSPSGSRAAEALAAARRLSSEGRLAEALTGLSAWYNHDSLSADERREVVDLLDQLAGTVIYSRQHLLEPAYEVQPGDTLERVAEAYQVPWQLLAKINGISDPGQLRGGQTLKVVRGPFNAVIDKDEYTLTLWLGPRYAGRFPVGLGAEGQTPDGTFDVKAKLENPTYYGPDGVVDADDPENPLGERWVDLGGGIGIHGTVDPNSVGRDETRGCIRLHPQDIEDVYDILTLGSKVLIRR